MQLTVGKNSILNFSRQILNRNVQSPSSVSTVMTHHSAQPKPVWKKAPPGPGPGHTVLPPPNVTSYISLLYGYSMILLYNHSLILLYKIEQTKLSLLY